ncbi:MAG: Tfx family DNA-binding protein, partial [Candidatus Thermoplasmatota archaeon]|nr:Tfx family DNA-binding protein [Candidatus Thermoplasmatota archaeon]
LIGTGVQNVLVLESRARKKIERARNTLEIIGRMNSAATILIEKGTHLLDAAKKVLSESDHAGVKLSGNVVDLMSSIRASCHDIIDNAVLTQSTAVYVDRDGRYSVHKFTDQRNRGK